MRGILTVYTPLSGVSVGGIAMSGELSADVVVEKVWMVDHRMVLAML